MYPLRRRILRSRVKQINISKMTDNYLDPDGEDNLFRGLLSATQTSCISTYRTAFVTVLGAAFDLFFEIYSM